MLNICNLYVYNKNSLGIIELFLYKKKYTKLYIY